MRERERERLREGAMVSPVRRMSGFLVVVFLPKNCKL